MMKNLDSLLKDGERFDDLQRDGLQIIQHPSKFCYGMDAVLLSSFVSAKKNDHILDLGTGTGILPILLSAKTEAPVIDALEIQEESVDMATRSVKYNHLEQRIRIIQGDIKTASSLLGKDTYDVITINPPYMTNEHGLKNPSMPLAIARHEILCSLDDILRESYQLLKSKGRFFMVHRPFRLAEIIAKMISYRIEPKRIQLVQPYDNKEPNMVLIEGRKDGNSRLTVEPTLVIYNQDGSYTNMLLDIYNN